MVLAQEFLERGLYFAIHDSTESWQSADQEIRVRPCRLAALTTLAKRKFAAPKATGAFDSNASPELRSSTYEAPFYRSIVDDIEDAAVTWNATCCC